MSKMELAHVCVQAMKDQSRGGSSSKFEKLIRMCTMMGRHMLHTYRIEYPTQRKIIYRRFDGSGQINVQRSLNDFCLYGRRMDHVISRARVQQERELNIAILYDDSNSMTARWRNKHFPYDPITEEKSPQTSAKIACLSLTEAFGKDADVSIITFGSKIDGPLSVRGDLYHKLVHKDGSGGTRMDLALQKLVSTRWTARPGAKILVILTDGVPETGARSEKHDILVQRRTLRFMGQMLEGGVRVLYVPLLLDKKLMHWKIGGYSAKTFAERLESMGVTVVEVYKLDMLLDGLFEGMRTISTDINAENTRKLMSLAATA